MRKFAFILVSLLLSAPLFAENEAERLEKRLGQIVPGATPEFVRQTPLPGIYEVGFGAKVFYFSADGRYLLRGELIDLEMEQNLTEASRSDFRLKRLAAVDPKSMLTYKPAGEVKHTITVFTDVDCVYCRKLHSGMAEMNELGIEVRYLAFPRAGLGSPTHQKMLSAWCADDQHAAMDAAKAGKPVPEKSCTDYDLAEHMALVRDFDINGTPAIVLENGTLIPGYVPPKELFARLEEAAKIAKK